MKRLLFGLFMLLLWGGSKNVVAQESNTKILIDSIVKISFNNDRVHLIDNSPRIFGNQKNLDPFLAEASTYFLLQQMFVPYFVGIYTGFTEDELRKILAFYNSESYRRISTLSLKKDLKALFAITMLGNFSAMISGKSWDLNVFKIADKEYDALADKYIKQIKFEESYDAIGDALLNDVKKESSVAEMNMIKGMLACYKYLLGKYVSKKQLREVVDFYSSSLGTRLLDKNVGTMVSMFSEISQNQERMAELEARKDSLVSVEDCLSYIDIAKRMSMGNRNFSLPVDTIHLKGKSVYVGEVFGVIPSGNGVLTDKEGVRYSGNFKDGKRHGLLTTYFVNGDSIRQYWADDKVMKNQGKDIDGLVPMHLGKAMGYGKLSSGEAYGYFVDGELHGEGGKIGENSIETGLFKHGRLVKGREVNYYDDRRRKVIFQKEVDGIVSKGVKIIIKSEKEGESKVRMEGSFIRGNLHGMGTYEYSNATFKSKFQGFFAYDELYGYGTSYKHWAKDDFVETYEGNFFASKYQGAGHLKCVFVTSDSIKYVQITKGNFENGNVTGNIEYEEKITRIPGSSWRFTRFGVKFTNLHDTLTISIKGTVKNKKLEGQAEIKTSNGDYYKGMFLKGEFREGFGCVHYEDNTKYEGGFKDGRFNGAGKFYYSDGTYDDGIFLKGYVKEGVYRNKKGGKIKNVRHIWENGKVIRVLK